MSGETTGVGAASTAEFHHEAMIYRGDEAFVTQTAAFIRTGLAREEPVLVVVSDDRAALIRDELGSDADAVDYADMADVGRNPARIIPTWREFVDRVVDDRRLWGIGDPVGAGRPPDALSECQRHEGLLNFAFADARLSLLCPYDAGHLDAEVIDEARRTHPYVHDDHGLRASDSYPGVEALANPFMGVLQEPVGPVHHLSFDLDRLGEVRAAAADVALSGSLSSARVADLVLAASETAANSLSHGGGRGDARFWVDDDAVRCEMRDAGRVDDPLVGRERPTADQPGGRGLWITNQVCDLVQVRSGPAGTVVRLSMDRF